MARARSASCFAGCSSARTRRIRPSGPAGRVADETLRQALRGREATAWYGSGPEREAIVAAAVPIMGAAGVEGAVVLEQASDPILTLTNRALVRLMSLTLLATVVVGVGPARLCDVAVVARAAARARGADRARAARRDS